jgi:cyclomaltodextrinase
MKASTLLLCAMITLHAESWSQRPMRISLDGSWLFRVDSLKVGQRESWFADTTDHTLWKAVTTPAFWESYPGMANYDGWGWFARTVVLPRIPAPMSLHFAGVDDEAVVWVNGIEVGDHTGYTDPFTLDLSGVLHEGANSVVVLVKDNGGGGGIYRPITLIETSAVQELLKGPLYGTAALQSADWVRQAKVYSVYLRSFSPEGTFAGLERRLPELKKLGVTVLWVLPIHPVGVKNRKGTLGSPYSVQDYYGINPEFGTMTDFKRLLAVVHKQGMKLIIDLVANHTSWDSWLLNHHPEWFRHNAAGAIVSPNADWTDAAQLDYEKPGLRQYMIDMMVWWVRDIGIDGFRCDVAELVPTDFWEEARARLNRIKQVMMISEGSLPEHHRKAFDLTYSWNVYDALEPILAGKRPVMLLDQILRTEELQFPLGALRMRFTTNHDKNAWDAPAVKKFGLDGLRVATVLVNTIPGVPLVYTGEEIPNPQRLSLFEKVKVDWAPPHAMEPLYRTLFQLRKEHQALSRGQMIRVTSSSPDAVYAFFRVAGSDRLLIVLNFARERLLPTVQVPLDRVLPGQQRITLEEVFKHTRIVKERDAVKEFPVDLPPRGFAVYVVR